MAQGRRYLFGDHPSTLLRTSLGSTSAAIDQTGQLTKQGYYAFGGGRYNVGALLTDYTFTGQKSDASDGLLFYNARYYDASIGRFISADLIVPSASPQNLNRYSYVRNSPLNFVDPTGYSECQPWDDWCWENRYWTAQGFCYNRRTETWNRVCTPQAQDKEIIEEIYGVKVEENWSVPELQELVKAFWMTARAFGGNWQDNLAAFRSIWGGSTYARCKDSEGWAGCYKKGAETATAWTIGTRVEVFDRAFTDPNHPASHYILHEMAHIWDGKVNGLLANEMAGYTHSTALCFASTSCLYYKPGGTGAFQGLYGPGTPGFTPAEDFADAFLAYVIHYGESGFWESDRSFFIFLEMLNVGTQSCGRDTLFVAIPWKCTGK